MIKRIIYEYILRFRLESVAPSWFELLSGKQRVCLRPRYSTVFQPVINSGWIPTNHRTGEGLMGESCCWFCYLGTACLWIYGVELLKENYNEVCVCLNFKNIRRINDLQFNSNFTSSIWLMIQDFCPSLYIIRKEKKKFEKSAKLEGVW